MPDPEPILQPKYDIRAVVRTVERAGLAAGVGLTIEVKHDKWDGDDERPSYLIVNGLYLYPAPVEIRSIGRMTTALGWAVDTVAVKYNYPRAPDDADPVTIIEPHITAKTGEFKYRVPRPAHDAAKQLVLHLIGLKIDAEFDGEPAVPE
jgi:hypothetical protein